MAVGRMDFDFRKVVIDTGPLFNALAIMYIRSSPIQRDRFLQKHYLPTYLKNNPVKERNFLQLFDSIQIALTTSHVIGEVQGLWTTSGLPPHAFWSFSMDLLGRKGLDEQLIRLLDMNEGVQMKELVCAVGPTDAGLIKLAREKECTLLTDDARTLAHHAWRSGVDCRLVKYLL